MKYKGYELMRAIAEGKIENGTKFYDESSNKLYKYENNNFIHVGYGGCNIVPLLAHTFELIEDKKEIDIQAMKEQTAKISFNFHKDSYTAHEIDYNFEKITEFLNIYNNKQNEIIKVIKQLDKQIHCRVCGKELAVKYGLCEKCYENVNEDVR